MTPKLKAPGSERSKVEHEKLLSDFAFSFTLRRYAKASMGGAPLQPLLPPQQLQQLMPPPAKRLKVRRCRLTPG